MLKVLNTPKGPNRLWSSGRKIDSIKLDIRVRTHWPVFVIPAHAGIQVNYPAAGLDSRVRGSDGFEDFLRIHQILIRGVFYV
jgi:hypothetical protein